MQWTYTYIRDVLWDPATAAASLCISTTSRPLHTDKIIYRNATTNQHLLLSSDKYTLIAAYDPTKIAKECKGEDGKINRV